MENTENKFEDDQTVLVEYSKMFKKMTQGLNKTEKVVRTEI